MRKRHQRSKVNVWETTEFNNWSKKNELIREEQELFNKYIEPLDRNSNILDVGTGNGRFLLNLAELGFSQLRGIDSADKLLDVARERATNFPTIRFNKMDASSLKFDDGSFEVVICLQQVLCFIEELARRMNAFKECYRVLKPGGLFIGSFLHYMGRWYNPAISLLSLLPKMTKGDFNFLNHQYLPWLKQGDSVNYRVLWEKQPYLYWFGKSELRQVLHNTGFSLREFKSSAMLCAGVDTFRRGGMLYVVSQK